LHSSNNPASLTSRLGATIDVEQNHVRFLGDLILNLWDCGGQDAFMDSYLSTQRSTIFQHVGVLIYVFEISTHDAVKDAAYYRDCLDALQRYSPEAAVFLLVHKMDLVPGDRAALLERRTRELQGESGTVPITVFGTSIHDETLYKVRPWPAFSLHSSRVPTDEHRHGRASYTPSYPTQRSFPNT
jgi:Ras-related GTP-binding protein A/B